MELARDQLKSIVARVERLEAEIKALNDDKSDIYKEARANGFDVKAIKKVVSQRKLDSNERQEADIVFETYWNAVHGVNLVRARVHGNIEEFDDETGELLSPASDDTPIVPPSPAESEAEEISAIQFQAKASGEQTERTTGHDEGAGSRREMRVGEAGRDYQPATSDDGRDGVERHAPNHEMDRDGLTGNADEAMAAEKGRKAIPAGPEGVDLNHAGAGESPATEIAPAPQGEAEAPSAERASELGMVELHLKYKPNCLRPKACSSNYIDRHCHSCAKAAAAMEVA